MLLIYLDELISTLLRLMVILLGMCWFAWAGAEDLFNNIYNFFVNSFMIIAFEKPMAFY